MTTETKTGNGFLCEFADSTGIFLPTFVIYKIDRPSFTISESEDGQIYWWPIKAELFDPIVPSTSQAVMSHISRKEFFNINIKLLDPVGDVVEEWKVVNAKIEYINFGTLDWRGYINTDEPLSVRLTIKYEYAELMF